MAGVLLVTGGGRGIGAATARLAAAHGYAVAVSYRARKDAADTLVAETLGGSGKCKHHTIGLDVSAALGQRRPERLVRDPWLDAPRLCAVEPTHRVA